MKNKNLILNGKLEIKSKVPLMTRNDLNRSYTPGVADPCREIAKSPQKAYDYTCKGNMVAVLSDGSAVLGLGNIGALASLPVMEGKAILFKKFANIDAFPICVTTQKVDEIIKLATWIEPTFGGINLEDISAPRCFEIEEKLSKKLSIPVFHDDQHGTAIVTLSGLINAAKVRNSKIEDLKIVIAGAGAAGIATCILLHKFGIKDIILCDSKGIIYKKRTNLHKYKHSNN